MTTQDKLTKRLEKLNKITNELSTITEQILDAEGSQRERLAKQRADLTSEQDLLKSEIVLLEARLHNERIGNTEQAIHQLREEIHKKETELKTARALLDQTQKAKEGINQARYYGSVLTRESVEHEAKIQGELVKHDGFVKIIINEKTALEYQLQAARQELEQLKASCHE